MSYEAWRITYQSSEQAAKAAYEDAQRYERLFAMAISSVVELAEAAGVRKEDQLMGGTVQALEAIEKLKARREKWKARALEAEQWNREMVAKAASNHLEGYRELGRKAAAAEEERDALAAKLNAAQKLADKDRVCSFGMHPYPEGKPGWKSKLGRDLHLAINGNTRGGTQ